MSKGIDVAAQLAFVGIDPLLFLRTHDPFERSLLMELGQRLFEYQQKRDHNLAVEIANCVGKLFKS